MDHLEKYSVHPKRKPNSFDYILLPTILLLLGLSCIFTVDGIVADHFKDSKLEGELQNFVDASEHFGTPYGQILGLVSVAAALGWSEPRAIRIFVGACSAGLVANLIKLCFGRTRPNHFDFENITFQTGFVSLFPFHSGGSAIESFPSAHTASAFGFAALLSWAYPRGQVVFLLFGLLTGVHRVTTSAHYPSDVFVGAAVGWVIGSSFTGSTPVARWFDRFESPQMKDETRNVDLSQSPDQSA